MLRAESHQKAMGSLEQPADRLQERLERLRLTAQWQNRPQSRLTNAQVATRSATPNATTPAKSRPRSVRVATSPSRNPRSPPATVLTSLSWMPSYTGCG